ncbi:MAG: exodeoxyribonuclease III [Bifidobacteriaceae bacterium]|jgi:exodeoxyribonuclease-3|nr:exodeoxyribonuclease III [Bifidobacteriaceae bacterium]
MRIFSWNVNGVRAVLKKGELKKLFQTEDVDILCLQEIKASEEQAEEELLRDDFLKDYVRVYNPATRKGYSGTAIFYLKELVKNHEEVTVKYNIPESIASEYDLGEANSEGRVVVAEFEKFFVVSVYTPNSKNDLSRLSLRYNDWDKAFLEYMLELETAKPVIFCGDLNVAHKEIDLANPKANVGKHGFTVEEREGIDNIIQAGFIDTFRHFYPDETGAYSWWSNFAASRARNIGWRIDYFFVSATLESKIKDARIVSSQFGSDHAPIELQIKE